MEAINKSSNVNTNTQRPFVAVLLAAYNGVQWISEQVDSILNQLEVDVQLFISVDLSSDETYDWCMSAANKYSNISVLDYGEHFGGAAKNFYRLIRDVDFSKFDYIALSDQDDIWLEHKLAHATQMVTANKLDAFSSDIIAFWPDGRETLEKKSYLPKKFDHYFEAASAGCTYVMTRQAMQAFKDFLITHWEEVNQVFSHDWIIYSFCRAQGMKWLIDDQALIRYRQHDSNQVGLNSGLNAHLKRFFMVKEKWYRTEVSNIVSLILPTDSVSFSLNRWFLVKNFWQLRRRTRDAVALLVMLVLGVF